MLEYILILKKKHCRLSTQHELKMYLFHFLFLNKCKSL